MTKHKFTILELRDKTVSLDEIEKTIGITFPPIYRAFLSNFKPEPKKQYAYLKRTIHESKFIDSDFRLLTALGYSSTSKALNSMEEDELGFITFKSIETLQEFCIPEEPEMEDMIFISEHESSDALLLGIGNHNRDKIYLYSDISEEEPIEYLVDNVFDFICKCQIVEYHLDRSYYSHIREIESSNLYKKWNEDYWRVKEG